MDEKRLEETFRGKDVSLGREIVEGLLTEELGVAVYELNPVRKKDFLMSRQPGEESFSVSEQDQTKHSLLGIILATDVPNEYVFLAVEEHGGVLDVDKSSSLNSEFDINTQKAIFLGGKFWEKMNEVHGREITTKIREDLNGQEFNQVATAAVLGARQERTKRKDRMAESRQNLKTSLF